MRKSDWVRLLITALLLVWLINYLDWEDVFNQLSRVSPGLFLLALVINVLATIFARALLVWSLVEKSSRPALATVIGVFFSLRFFSTVLPRALVVGLRIKRMGDLFGKKLTFAIGLMSYEALTGALVMSLGAVAYYLLLAGSISRTPAIIYVLAAAALLISLFLLLFTHKLDFAIKRILQIPLISDNARKKLNSVLDQWRSWVEHNVARSHSTLFVTLGFAVAFYLGFIISGYVLFLAMGESLAFSEIAWARSAVWLLAALPISIGGLGVREAGLAYLLADFGVEFELAVAYGFLSFILQTAIGLLGAVVELKNAAPSR
jgi:uncharacterized protein (TIRG00374 family)